MLDREKVEEAFIEVILAKIIELFPHIATALGTAVTVVIAWVGAHLSTSFYNITLV